MYIVIIISYADIQNTQTHVDIKNTGSKKLLIHGHGNAV